MATAVSNGSFSQHSDQMHPFFRHAHGSKPQASSTDLPSDINPHRNRRGEYTCPSTPGSNDQVTHPLPDTSDPPSSQEMIQTEIDPNSNRRKRRKITPSPHNDQINTVESNKGAESTQSWRQQLEEAASSLNESMLPTPATARQPESGGPPAASTTPRRSSRISISKRIDADSRMSPKSPAAILPHPSREQSDHQPSPEKSPPKRKMLKLTNKGKLVTSSPPSTKAKSTTKARPKQAGELILHQGRIKSSRKIAIPYRGHKDEKERIAGQVEKILKGQLHVSLSNKAIEAKAATDGKLKSNKPTHPFFQGKGELSGRASPAPATTGGQSTREGSVETSILHVKQPVPWNEIKFRTSKLSHVKDVGTQEPLWPPLEFRHIQPLGLDNWSSSQQHYAARGAKQKREQVLVNGDEDVFQAYASKLRTAFVRTCAIRLPERLYLDGKQLVELIEKGPQLDALSMKPETALQHIKTRTLTSRSAFDRGAAAGPQDWAHAYAPRQTEEVLQPQSRILQNWLTRLKVHQVQSKLSAKTQKVSIKRANRRRKTGQNDDLDDFIISSDDEVSGKSSDPKNVIVICGPPGCGKTAAVYAVAHELDFEVFEIHPGMRRTAKDIFDKVGDMAHNHLVQPSTALSRDSSTLTESLDQGSIEEDIASGKQATMASFLGGRKKATVQRPSAQTEKTSNQKQSLILFEEVDILFEEDKSFWAGVQTLMQQSRRPIVLTCNSLESVPLDELDVHATLFFDRPSVPDAVEYLAYIAAAEGHLLNRHDLKALFLGRGQDLRASLMELNFWCQMTVGSKLGGLDWMRTGGSSQFSNSRIVSKGTFCRGVNIIPERDLCADDLLRFAESSLELSALDWEDADDQTAASMFPGHNHRLQDLRDFVNLAETRSCMGVLDSSTAPIMSTLISAAFPQIHRQPSWENVVDVLLTKPSHLRLCLREIVDVLEPIMEDHRTFPPTTGRAAASLDGAGQTVATDIAPYVRSIVAFDQRLEEQRNELAGGPQASRHRRTRAARAALEGGDKANTRRERWFPKDLDFERVLRTSPGWPFSTSQEFSCNSPRSSQATLSEGESATATLSERNDTHVEKDDDVD